MHRLNNGNMVIIIIGPQGSGKTDFAHTLKTRIIKPSYPDIIDGVPPQKPKGLKVENKIYCTQIEYDLPDWCYKSPHVIIFHL